MKLKEGQEIYLKCFICDIDNKTNMYKVKLSSGEVIDYWIFNKELVSTISKKEKVGKWFEVETESANLILINLDKIIVIGQNVAGEYIVELSEHNNFKITKDSYNKLKERLMEE